MATNSRDHEKAATPDSAGGRQDTIDTVLAATHRLEKQLSMLKELLERQSKARGNIQGLQRTLLIAQCVKRELTTFARQLNHLLEASDT
jgi:hypothetical protein